MWNAGWSPADLFPLWRRRVSFLDPKDFDLPDGPVSDMNDVLWACAPDVPVPPGHSYYGVRCKKWAAEGVNSGIDGEPLVSPSDLRADGGNRWLAARSA
jgi:hypothetical protein